MNHEHCIFCNIIQGKSQAAKVYEDEHVYAFMDISQVTTGHTLVIPKLHVKDIYELSEEVASHLFKCVPKIANAIKTAYKPLGLNILNNNAAVAGQSVFHLHLHLIPRYGDDEGFNVRWIMRNNEFSTEKLQEIAGRIANEL